MHAETSPPVHPSVRLVAGDDASGMATMLGEVLADNMRDYPGRARAAQLVRGPVVMTASDRDRSVTVHFGGDEISIAEGTVDGAPCIFGPWLDLAQLCSGQLSPLQAVREKRLEISHMRRIDLLAAAGYVLSVPASYYGETSKILQRKVVIPVVAIVVVLVVVAMMLVLARSRRVTDRAG